MNSYLELNDGSKMPTFGLGTFKLKVQECTDAAKAALDSGYQLIDTATVYRNEQDIGEALRAPGAPSREKVFITSKISPKQMGNPLAAIEESLQKLGVTYLDLCLLHWPGTGGLKQDDPRQPEKRLQSWQALQTAQKNGWCRSIGVSNFQARHIEHSTTQANRSAHSWGWSPHGEHINRPTGISLLLNKRHSSGRVRRLYSPPAELQA